MSKRDNYEDFLKDIADGIRTATSTLGEIKAQDMRAKIESIPKIGPDGGITPSGSIDITSNGTYDVTGYESVNVDVEGETSTTPEIHCMNALSSYYYDKEGTNETVRQYTWYWGSITSAMTIIDIKVVIPDENGDYFTVTGDLPSVTEMYLTTTPPQFYYEYSFDPSTENAPDKVMAIILYTI